MTSGPPVNEKSATGARSTTFTTWRTTVDWPRASASRSATVCAPGLANVVRAVSPEVSKSPSPLRSQLSPTALSTPVAVKVTGTPVSGSSANVKSPAGGVSGSAATVVVGCGAGSS